MTVDFFLVDAPHVVPVEFAAWRAAQDRHDAIVLEYLGLPAGAPGLAELDQAGREAGAESRRLEEIARQAWTTRNRLNRPG